MLSEKSGCENSSDIDTETPAKPDQSIPHQPANETDLFYHECKFKFLRKTTKNFSDMTKSLQSFYNEPTIEKHETEIRDFITENSAKVHGELKNS